MASLNNEGSQAPESPTQVLCVTDVDTAELVRLFLAVNEIRNAVIRQDPFRLAAASVEVLVAAADLLKAREVVEDSCVAQNVDCAGRPANRDVLQPKQLSERGRYHDAVRG